MLDRYTVYSEKYIAVSSETIYQREVMSIVAPGSYMGIWQIFALATVLGRTIVVFYPNRGHLRVTEDMNRLVQPRVERCDTCLYIMWTTTRQDTTADNWVPNYFVHIVSLMTTEQDDTSPSLVDDPAVKRDMEMQSDDGPKWTILDISPLPTLSCKSSKRCKVSEILTSSPYKRNLQTRTMKTANRNKAKGLERKATKLPKSPV